GTEDETGKTLGRDADLGKLTLPVIRFLAGAEPAVRSRIQSLLASDASKHEIAQILAESGELDEARAVAESYVRSAIENLAILQATEANDALIAAAEFVTVRRR